MSGDDQKDLLRGRAWGRFGDFPTKQIVLACGRREGRVIHCGVLVELEGGVLRPQGVTVRVSASPVEQIAARLTDLYGDEFTFPTRTFFEMPTFVDPSERRPRALVALRGLMSQYFSDFESASRSPEQRAAFLKLRRVAGVAMMSANVEAGDLLRAVALKSRDACGRAEIAEAVRKVADLVWEGDTSYKRTAAQRKRWLDGHGVMRSRRVVAERLALACMAVGMAEGVVSGLDVILDFEPGQLAPDGWAARLGASL